MANHRPACKWCTLTELMAAQFSSNIFHLSRLRITRSIHENTTDLWHCITQGARWCSTSLEPHNKFLEDKNVDDNIHERMHVADIRRLCKTEVNSNPEVSKLFNQFLQLPEQYRTKFVNSALYWFSYYDKIDEALELKTLMEEHGIPKNHSTYSSLAVLYSKSGEIGNIKGLIDEMTRDGLTPRARHYAPFFNRAVKRGDLLGAFHSMNEMQQSVFNNRNTDKYKALIRACTGQQNKELTSKVLEIFYDFQKYRDLLSNDTLAAIKLWFDSQDKPKWITSWSTASVTFDCQVCKQKLETGKFCAAELEELKHSLAKHLWKKHKALKQVRCFTSAGNYVDYVRPSQLNTIPQSVELFIKTTGPYDVVIDGLNVAYFTGFFDPRKVENMVSHFVNQKKRVLVVSSSPMTLLTRTKKGAQTPLGALMNFLTEQENCSVFCLAESSMDDLYFLSAAMHCGPGTHLVSCDKFYDHLSGMDPLMKVHFRRWQNLNQMELERFIGYDPVFTVKKLYDSAVQTTGDTWHFPSSDENRWLCVRKTEI